MSNVIILMASECKFFPGSPQTQHRSVYFCRCKGCACDCIVKATDPMTTQCKDVMISSELKCLRPGFDDKRFGHLRCAFKGGLYLKSKFEKDCRQATITIDHCIPASEASSDLAVPADM